MTEGITKNLIDRGVQESQIHGEKFISPTTISLDDIVHQDVVIEFNSKKYQYSGKESLLEFFESQGVDIPFACRSGVCGSCKVKSIEGKSLNMSDSGLKEREKRDCILTCVSWPEENLILDDA